MSLTEKSHLKVSYEFSMVSVRILSFDLLILLGNLSTLT